MAMAKHLQSGKEKVDEKSGIMQQQLQGDLFNMMELDGLQLPHEPHIKVYSVNPKECFVFKSAIMPMRMSFNARVFPEDWQEG